MQNYLDIIDRANTGPRLKKDSWDFDVIVMTTRKLVEKYNLTWDSDVIVPDDPKLADRVFDAGLEMACATGVFSLSTNRIINLELDELEEKLRANPQSLVLGEGKDTRTLYARGIMDSRPPIIWAGNPGAPTPEHLFLASVVSWAQEPIVDMISCGSLTEVNGYDVRTGEPMEIIATRRELKYLHEALQRVGRPGMGLLGAQSSVSELGDLAVAHPDLLRSCDAHLVPMLNEMMIDNRNIARAVNSIGYGMFNASLPTVMVGGLAGDAPGAAIVQTASFIAANIVCLADYHILHPIHIRHVATSTRSVMWVQSVVAQAFARNAPSIIVADIYPKSGAMTQELLYEVAANAIVNTVSGSHLEGVGSADGAKPNGTGLEARLMGEIGHAAVRQNLSLSEANLMTLKILEKYEFVFDLPDGNPGVRFDKAYNVSTVKPVPEWEKLYADVKTDLRSLGLHSL